MMASVKAKDTQPEMRVRKLLHSLGYRYRLHKQALPGKPDIVFSSRKKVVFVHGCFWHQHTCRAGHLPKSNLSYWGPKLKRNKERDKKSIKDLRKLGWSCLVLWECEIKNELLIKKKLEDFLTAT